MKHKTARLFTIVVVCSMLSAGFGPVVKSRPGQQVGRIDIASAGASGLARIAWIVEHSGSCSWWSEVGPVMLVNGTPEAFARLASAGFPAVTVPGVTGIGDLRVVVGGHQNTQLAEKTQVQDLDIVIDAGRIKVISADPATVAGLDLQANRDRAGSGVFKVRPNQVILRLAGNDATVESFLGEQEQLVDEAAARVDRSRWWGDVQTLSAWNRHISSAGNAAARDWIKGQFESIPGMEVSLQDFRVQGRDAWNVVATLPASKAAQAQPRTVIVGGHFDSISERPSASAPGAEDNASGAAGVIELARVLAGMPRAHEVVFVAFSGEEQGLHGSAAFVESLSAQQRQQIAGTITMDMIAFARSGAQGKLGVLIETTRSFAAFGRLFADAAARVTKLQVSTSYNPFGSDHMSFLDEGIPAILSIDVDWNSYGHYHRTTDTVDKLTPELAHEILKMNVAVAAALASQAG